MSEIETSIGCDLWDKLQSEAGKKPIVLYGTGDGADKIISVLESKRIPLAGVFASDGFKQGKLFHGHEVTSYANMSEKFSDFTVLLAFATSLDNVIENIKRIAFERELYAPDVPVFGDGLFDMEYFRGNKSRLKAIYDRLSDNLSRKTFVNALKYRLTGKIDCLFDCESTLDEQLTTLVGERAIEGIVDIGAYTGDTLEIFLNHFGDTIPSSAFEPDAKNFAKLEDRCKEKSFSSVKLFNVAAWNEKKELEFFSRSGRNSAATTKHGNAKSVFICADKVDNLLTHSCGFVKIDAEGAEERVLCGMENTIIKYRPIIKCAAYHRTDDYLAIPEKVLSLCPNYKIYMRHLKYIPCWDTDFIFTI